MQVTCWLKKFGESPPHLVFVCPHIPMVRNGTQILLGCSQDRKQAVAGISKSSKPLNVTPIIQFSRLI